MARYWEQESSALSGAYMQNALAQTGDMGKQQMLANFAMQNVPDQRYEWSAANIAKLPLNAEERAAVVAIVDRVMQRLPNGYTF